MTTTNNAVIYHDFTTNNFGMQDTDPCVVEIDIIDRERINRSIKRKKINKRRNRVACAIAFFFAMVYTSLTTAISIFLIHAIFHPSEYVFIGIGIIVSIINILIGGFGYEYIEERVYHKNRY